MVNGVNKLAFLASILHIKWYAKSSCKRAYQTYIQIRIAFKRVSFGENINLILLNSYSYFYYHSLLELLYHEMLRVARVGGSSRHQLKVLHRVDSQNRN